MKAEISRRAVFAGIVGSLARLGMAKARAPGELSPHAGQLLADVEARAGGRLGVAVLDSATGERLAHRAGERFPLCSTFKFLAAAAILHRVDRGQERLDRWIGYGPDDLLEYAPVSKQHAEQGGMLLGDVCAAAVQWSDNTAANLLFSILGGPAGLTSYIRGLGDEVTRIDAIEPALNAVRPGESHDTTSPAAMVGLLRSVLLEKVLSPDSRARLEQWMLGAKVGEHRVRAGLPADWPLAHKTGTWDDQTNDVGLIRPPERSPLLFAVYYSGAGELARRERVLSDVGRIMAQWAGSRG